MQRSEQEDQDEEESRVASNLEAMTSMPLAMASNPIAPIAMASNLEVMASVLLAMASNLEVMASNLEGPPSLLAMASNLEAMTSILLAMASNPIAPIAMASNFRKGMISSDLPP